VQRPVTVHTAGQIEANGEQRCLGCDLLLRRSTSGTGAFYRMGQLVGYSVAEGDESFFVHPFARRRKLRAYETPCHELRVRPAPMAFEPVAAE